MNIEMENGTQMTLEQWMPEACPKQIAGVSERHARILALRGNEQDWAETDRALYEKFLDSWKNKKSKTDLNGLSMKMLRECFLATKDSTICQSSLKWTNSGTISNGRISIANGLYHKTESGFTLSDILENTVAKKILPISTADRENSAKKIEKSIKKESGTKKILTSFCDLNYGAGINLTESARTLQARYYKGATKFKGGTTGVAIGFIDPQERRKKKVEPKEVCPTLRSETHGNVPEVTIKVREATKKGYTEAKEGDSINFSMPNSKTRRGRVGHGVAQTLDTSCNQGIFVQVNEDFAIYAIWYEKYNCYIAIRKLTPRECFRLQGWTDEYYNRAEFVNTDTQLYKQAGNGVTVNVITEIGKKIR